jgi:molybdenum cofactor cytidylyltransferase
VIKVGAVVLAAGRSSRYRAGGGSEETKLVAELDGQPIVRHTVAALLASRARPIVVVTGHARSAVEAALTDLPASLRFNSNFADGIATSLRVGLAAMPNDVDGALVLLGDMPHVRTQLIDALIHEFDSHPKVLAVAPVQDGRRGNPVLLSRSLFDAAMRLEGDEGAKRILAALEPGHVIEIAASDSDAALDIDTPSDLERVRKKNSNLSSSYGD